MSIDENPVKKILSADITKINIELGQGLVVEPEVFDPNKYIATHFLESEVDSEEAALALKEQNKVLVEDSPFSGVEIVFGDSKVVAFTVDDIENL